MKNTYTNTEPIVYHAPGKTRRLPMWGRLVHGEFSSSVVDCPSFDVITWSTTSGETTVEKSLKSFGYDATVLRKAKDTWSNIDKVFLTVEFARQSSSDYIIGLDAFDVVLTKHPSHIVDLFTKNFDCDLLFNAANCTWPKNVKAMKSADDFEEEFGGKNRHLNAGCWIGKREYVLEFFEKVKRVERDIIFATRYRGTEQTSVKLAAFPDEYPRLDIDRKCVIFQHLRGYKDLVDVD